MIEIETSIAETVTFPPFEMTDAPSELSIVDGGGIVECGKVDEMYAATAVGGGRWIVTGD